MALRSISGRRVAEGIACPLPLRGRAILQALRRRPMSRTEVPLITGCSHGRHELLREDERDGSSALSQQSAD